MATGSFLSSICLTLEPLWPVASWWVGVVALMALSSSYECMRNWQDAYIYIGMLDECWNTYTTNLIILSVLCKQVNARVIPQSWLHWSQSIKRRWPRHPPPWHEVAWSSAHPLMDLAMDQSSRPSPVKAACIDAYVYGHGKGPIIIKSTFQQAVHASAGGRRMKQHNYFRSICSMGYIAVLLELPHLPGSISSSSSSSSIS